MYLLLLLWVISGSERRILLRQSKPGEPSLHLVVLNLGDNLIERGGSIEAWYDGRRRELSVCPNPPGRVSRGLLRALIEALIVKM